MTVSYTPPFNLQNNTAADATQVMANFNAVTTALQNAASSGVNSDITQLTGLTTPITPSQGGTTLYVGGTTTGTANAQVLATPTPTGFSLTNGRQILFLPGFTNTGATTLNIGVTGAIPVHVQTTNGDQALVGGELQASQWCVVVYDSGTSTYRLMSVGPQQGGVGPLTNINSAATTDLSLATGHFAVILGTTTITSFGSNANTNFPVYRVAFAGTLTLTHNATSLALPGATNITTAQSDNCVAVYLGSGNWRVVEYTRANGQPIVPAQPPPASFSNLSIKVATNTTVAVSATAVTMWDTNNNPLTGALSATLDLGSNGAVNKLDAGTIAIDTWYAVWAISNGTTIGTLASTSFTSPTLPSGYTYKARIGAVQTIHASATLYGTWQLGKDAQYVVGLAQTTQAPAMATGTSGSMVTPTWTATATTRFVPPSASKIRFILFTYPVANNSTAGGAMVAPNNGFGAFNSLTNPPPFSVGVLTTIVGNTELLIPMSGEFLLESSNVYYAANTANSGLNCLGWTDNL